MRLPVLLLCIVTAASAAPQLFFVVPQRFLTAKQSELDQESLVPVVVPIINSGKRGKSLSQESPGVVNEASQIQKMLREMDLTQLANFLRETLDRKDITNKVPIDISSAIVDKSLFMTSVGEPFEEVVTERVSVIVNADQENVEVPNVATEENIRENFVGQNLDKEVNAIVLHVDKEVENKQKILFNETLPEAETTVSIFDQIIQEISATKVKQTNEGAEVVAVEEKVDKGSTIKETQEKVVIAKPIKEITSEVSPVFMETEQEVITEGILTDSLTTAVDETPNIKEIQQEIILPEVEEIPQEVTNGNAVQESVGGIQDEKNELQPETSTEKVATLKEPALIETTTVEENFATEALISEDILQETLTTDEVKPEISVQEGNVNEIVVVEETQQIAEDVVKGEALQPEIPDEEALTLEETEPGVSEVAVVEENSATESSVSEDILQETLITEEVKNETSVRKENINGVLTIKETPGVLEDVVTGEAVQPEVTTEEIPIKKDTDPIVSETEITEENSDTGAPVPEDTPQETLITEEVKSETSVQKENVNEVLTIKETPIALENVVTGKAVQPEVTTEEIPVEKDSDPIVSEVAIAEGNSDTEVPVLEDIPQETLITEEVKSETSVQEENDNEVLTIKETPIIVENVVTGTAVQPEVTTEEIPVEKDSDPIVSEVAIAEENSDTEVPVPEDTPQETLITEEVKSETSVQEENVNEVVTIKETPIALENVVTGKALQPEVTTEEIPVEKDSDPIVSEVAIAEENSDTEVPVPEDTPQETVITEEVKSETSVQEENVNEVITIKETPIALENVVTGKAVQPEVTTEEIPVEKDSDPIVSEVAIAEENSDTEVPVPEDTPQETLITEEVKSETSVQEENVNEVVTIKETPIALENVVTGKAVQPEVTTEEIPVEKDSDPIVSEVAIAEENSDTEVPVPEDTPQETVITEEVKSETSVQEENVNEVVTIKETPIALENVVTGKAVQPEVTTEEIPVEKDSDPIVSEVAIAEENSDTEVPVLEDTPQETVITEEVKSETSAQKENINKIITIKETPIVVENVVSGKAAQPEVTTEEIPVEKDNKPIVSEAAIVEGNSDTEVPVPEDTPQEILVVGNTPQVVEDVVKEVVNTELSPQLAKENIFQEVILPEESTVIGAPVVVQVVEETINTPSGDIFKESPVLETVMPEDTPSLVATKNELTETVQETLVQVARKLSPLKEIHNAIAVGKIVIKPNVTRPKEPVHETVPHGSGKSLNTNSIDNRNAIDHSVATHFGFRNPSSILRTPSKYFMHQGTLVDPKMLVAPQFRSFIYHNDSPDVIAAKVAFFRFQGALTSSQP